MGAGGANLQGDPNLENDDAVIKMTVKTRSPAMRLVQRTHRVDLDWLFERFLQDDNVNIKFVGTKYQLADILTKGSFTAQSWRDLLALIMFHKPFTNPTPKSN